MRYINLHYLSVFQHPTNDVVKTFFADDICKLKMIAVLQNSINLFLPASHHIIVDSAFSQSQHNAPQ